MNAETLLAGPRGRRMLLEYALASERAISPEYREDSFAASVFQAGHQLDPGRGTSRVVAMFGGGKVNDTGVSPDMVAQRVHGVTLATVTPHTLRAALQQAVDSARYWQEPDGEDVLVTTEPVRAALSRVAEHLVASGHTDWWSSSVQLQDQWAVEWLEEGLPPSPERTPAAHALSLWRLETRESEERARRQRPQDPTAGFSGQWWSIPPYTLQHSTRNAFDGTPVGLWYVEDSHGWDRARAMRLAIPEDTCVLEITSAANWAALCAAHPIDVTWEKRHDWYRATGRDGQWLEPDWAALACEYGGVHLTVAAYLEAAGALIPVGPDAASTIAGWNPDQTWWFFDPQPAGATVQFQAESNNYPPNWQPISPRGR